MAVTSFEEVQALLPQALEANRPGSAVDHVVVALPSYSLGESLLSHYADRIPALEHRYLVSQLVLHRLPRCHVVFVSSRLPDAEVIDYYASLRTNGDTKSRFHALETGGDTSRPVAAVLLEQPEMLQRIRDLIGNRPALIEPWNVTEAEVEVALALGVPINGTDPALRNLGFKSEGRRLFRSAGVPIPVGVEDVRSASDVLSAIARIRRIQPGTNAVIVKHDDSGSGDGNVTLDLREPDIAERLRALPDWYTRDLESGGVVEERVTGTQFTSPSAQIDIVPGGNVVVLSTHDQVLGGPDNQVYMGCRFPADPAYAADLARYATAVGHELAERGVIGRVAVDFAATRDWSGRWSLYALEVNLRKGGTTHPYTTLRSLLPGRYDAEAARWVVHEGDMTRVYSATDNLVDAAWTGLPPAEAIRAVADAGLQFDERTGTGVVLHMLPGLAIDGRLGLTAIGRDPAHADELHRATERAIDAAAKHSTSRPEGQYGER